MLIDNISLTIKVGVTIKIIQKIRRPLFTQSQLETWLINIKNSLQFVKKI